MSLFRWFLELVEIPMSWELGYGSTKLHKFIQGITNDFQKVCLGKFRNSKKWKRRVPNNPWRSLWTFEYWINIFQKIWNGSLGINITLAKLVASTVGWCHCRLIIGIIVGSWLMPHGQEGLARPLWTEGAPFPDPGQSPGRSFGPSWPRVVNQETNILPISYRRCN